MPFVCTLLTSAKYTVDDDIQWSRKKKQLSHYVSDLIKVLYSQAGISPTIKPGLPFLPALSAVQVEFSHLYLNHILPRACSAVKKSFPGYSTNSTIKSILNKV